MALYRVTAAPEENWAKVGATYLLADALAESVFKAAKVESFEKVRQVAPGDLKGLTAAHPLAGRGYDFVVPLLDGGHVTDEAGTGFVHTAPSHGRDDFDIWMENNRRLRAGQHRHAHPLHGRCRWFSDGRCAGLFRAPRHRRQGQQGRRQRSP